MAGASTSIFLQQVDEHTLKLVFPYDPATVEIIRRLPKRQYNAAEKCWYIPNDRSIVDQLAQMIGPERLINKDSHVNVNVHREHASHIAATCTAPSSPNAIAVADFIDRLEREIKTKNYSMRTRQNYRDAVRRFLEETPVDPYTITQDTLKKYLIHLREEHNFSPRTVNLCAAALHFFFREVLNYPDPVVSLPRMKVGRPLPDIYSEEEVAKILSAVHNPKHRVILMLAYGCGLRLSEIRNLKRTNIDLDRRILTVRHGKGAKDRRVMIDEVLLPELTAYLKTGCGRVWLFEGPDSGFRLSARTISLIFEHACTKAGVNRRGGIHGLRHSFATHLMEHGTGLRCIQELLGHSSIKTTEIYTHVSSAAISKIRSPLAHIKFHPNVKSDIKDEV